jgi:repressor LexA
MELRMPQALNDIEQRILDYMVSYLRSNTYQPSIREIGERFGIKSTKTVSEHLQALAEKGFLERDPSRSRGVRILGVDLHSEAVSVPVFRPISHDGHGLRLDRAETRMTLDRRLAGTKGAIVIRMAGEELAALAIHDGDLVLVEPTTPADVPDGGVVLVRLEAGAAVFRRLTRNGTGVHLSELRAASPPMHVEEPARLDLVGQVAGFFRGFDAATSPANLTTH